MPFEPDAATWGELLGASRIYRDTELGEKAAHMIFQMEPDNMFLSRIYMQLLVNGGDVGKMRVKMRDTGVKNLPGYSWIEVQNKIHTFSVGDALHPQRESICSFLKELDLRMKKEGYVSSTKLVLHDVEEEEKEHMFKHHSENLAVAFGILTTPAGRPILYVS
ncbi:Pentatricopeptide repeat-containing protein [Heracleum sosnowskyi]|uniref:Pentatricopeptide repeat-containing protein n=1 Tax=Heracleum sosnowskyi TaxID=360622 RepID=A0AAD8H823_9APIA|nr:Pentatricopeptide repeat-containing protein [Heracleum sosnowskyi]